MLDLNLGGQLIILRKTKLKARARNWPRRVDTN